MTVHTCAHSKMPQHNIFQIMSNYFPMNWFQDISMSIDSRQSIQLCPYHMGEYVEAPYNTSQHSHNTHLHILVKEAYRLLFQA